MQVSLHGLQLSQSPVADVLINKALPQSIICTLLPALSFLTGSVLPSNDPTRPKPQVLLALPINGGKFVSGV